MSPPVSCSCSPRCRSWHITPSRRNSTPPSPSICKGVVTKVEWQNPHTFFYIDVTDDATRKVTNWAFEMGSPNGLMRNGWTRNSLKVGDVVSVEGSRARDGSALGNARVVVLASTGQRLFAASSQTETP